jgi:hypothetical protein
VSEGGLKKINFNQQSEPSITITVENFIGGIAYYFINKAEENHSFATLILTFNAGFFE